MIQSVMVTMPWPGKVGTVKLCMIWIYMTLAIEHVESRRYRYCSEGCCPEEFCAFHLICYPKTHCFYGCPDGTCQKSICMPTKPCTGSSDCAVGNVCTQNFNLGYRTCQYNLNMGKTLCVDRHGKPLLKPET